MAFCFCFYKSPSEEPAILEGSDQMSLCADRINQRFLKGTDVYISRPDRKLIQSEPPCSPLAHICQCSYN